MVDDHCRNGAETLVFSVSIHGNGPKGTVVKRWIRRFPTGKFIAGHGVRPHIAVFQTCGPDLLPDHSLDAAYIGERGDAWIDQRFECTQNFRHGFKRIA